jgi:L-aminopeptidase/D-esterase-like protein
MNAGVSWLDLMRRVDMDTHVLQQLGIKIGHYTDEKILTGTTVFIAEAGATIGIDIRGSNAITLSTPA